MRRAAVLVALGAGFAAGSASAQHQPYARLESRPIKALSEEQIADLRAGRGMGLALAAELNGYPGPLHVIELAEPLGLSEKRGAEAQALYEAMRAETIPIGERLIAAEADLDRTPASLEAATQAIGRIAAELRAAHLRYHLSTTDLLMPEQVRRYAALRGYGKSATTTHGRHGHAGGH